MNEFKIIKIAFFWKSLRCHLNSKWNLHRKNLYILSHISYIKSIHCKYMAYNQLFFPCNNISILVMHTAIITGMGKNVTWNTRFLKVFLHVQSFKEIVWLIVQGKSAVRLFFQMFARGKMCKNNACMSTKRGYQLWLIIQRNTMVISNNSDTLL